MIKIAREGKEERRARGTKPVRIETRKIVILFQTFVPKLKSVFRMDSVQNSMFGINRK